MTPRWQESQDRLRKGKPSSPPRGIIGNLILFSNAKVYTPLATCPGWNPDRGGSSRPQPTWVQEEAGIDGWMEFIRVTHKRESGVSESMSQSHRVWKFKYAHRLRTFPQKRWSCSVLCVEPRWHFMPMTVWGFVTLSYSHVAYLHYCCGCTPSLP